MTRVLALLAILLTASCTTTRSWTYEELGVRPPRTCRLTLITDAGPTGCVAWYPDPEKRTP